MKINSITGISVLSLGLCSFSLSASEGETLYQENCTRCHDTEVFTRDDHKVKSLEELKNQVKQCNHATESGLNDEEIKTVVDYLNEHFYKF